jgi:hypothetical protein
VIVPRNVHELSEEVIMPSLSRDVHSLHRLAFTRKAHQQRRLLKSRHQLADGEVERVGLGPPVIQKRMETSDAILLRYKSSHAVCSLKQIKLIF